MFIQNKVYLRFLLTGPVFKNRFFITNKVYTLNYTLRLSGGFYISSF